jgi:(2Fe-2S) ferredoxin
MTAYDIHVFVCVNQRPPGDPRGSCADKGSVALRDYFKEAVRARGVPGRVRVNQAGCLDQCRWGPSVVIYPAGVWYTVRTTDEIDTIIEEHLLAGRPVERLRLGAR